MTSYVSKPGSGQIETQKVIPQLTSFVSTPPAGGGTFYLFEAVQKERERRTFSLNFVMPDSDPASPAYYRDGRSRIPQRYYKKEDALDLLFLKSL